MHRDLKPGNVMITKSGVKLLDFGLAKAMAPPMPKSSLTSLPTQQGLTQEGTILGTFQYMAPEQLEGKDSDGRTDVFAFGCVLYEMATGKKAFSAASQASLITAIMSSDPAPISSVQPMSPPALDRVVKTCLAKDPEDRWQSAGDVAKELKWIAEGSAAGVSAPPALASRRRNRERIAWGAFAVAALAAAAAGIVLFRRPAVPASVVRFEVVPTDESPYRDVQRMDLDMAPAVSPDARLLVFKASGTDRKMSLWVRPLDGFRARPLPGTENGNYPFWSPDSLSIGFFADGKLKRMEASGGPVQVLCDAEAGRGGTWSRNGVILFSPSAGSPIFRVPASGGKPEPVLAFDSAHGEDSQRWPHFLPDGRHFLYFSYLGANPESKNQNGGIRVASLDSKEVRVVVPEASNPVYAEPGYVLFARDGNLLAQKFDAKALRSSSEPIPVAQGVAVMEPRKLGYFSVSATGALVYARAVTFPSRLLWFDRQGRQVGTVGEAGGYLGLRLSSDGRRLTLVVAGADSQSRSIWIYDLVRGSKAPLSSEGKEGSALLSPDGSRIAFSSVRGGPPRLFVRSVGGGAEEALLKTNDAEIPVDWSPDGRLIAYAAPDASSNWDIWIVPLQGDRKPFPFAKTSAIETQAKFSPDGRWIATVASEAGKEDEVYVAPFPGPGERVQVSTAGGSVPRWRGDGKELFYLAPDRRLMAVPIQTEGALEAGIPTPLFETRGDIGASGYDVTGDGQRFLVITPVREDVALPIAVVLNWTSVLEKAK